MPCRFADSTLTVTPGTVRSCVSTTRPEIVPVVLCAWATPEAASVATTSQIPNLMKRIESLPNLYRC